MAYVAMAYVVMVHVVMAYAVMAYAVVAPGAPGGISVRRGIRVINSSYLVTRRSAAPPRGVPERRGRRAIYKYRRRASRSDVDGGSGADGRVASR